MILIQILIYALMRIIVGGLLCVALFFLGTAFIGMIHTDIIEPYKQRKKENDRIRDVVHGVLNGYTKIHKTKDPEYDFYIPYQYIFKIKHPNKLIIKDQIKKKEFIVKIDPSKLDEILLRIL